MTKGDELIIKKMRWIISINIISFNLLMWILIMRACLNKTAASVF